MSDTQGITVQEFNIFALGGEAVSYHLKDIHTIALQVTPQNIGILSLELEVELRYDEFANPYVTFAAARGTKEEPEADRHYKVGPDSWLVILWDEIHVFQDLQFRSTFSFDENPNIVISDENLKAMRDYLNRDIKATAMLFDPAGKVDLTEKTQITSAVGELYPEGEGPKSYVDDQGVRRPIVEESREPGETQD